MHLCPPVKPVALQSIPLAQIPPVDLCQAHTSVPGAKPTNASDTNGFDENQSRQDLHADPEWHQKVRDFYAADPSMAYSTVALKLQTELGVKVSGRQVRAVLASDRLSPKAMEDQATGSRLKYGGKTRASGLRSGLHLPTRSAMPCRCMAGGCESVTH